MISVPFAFSIQIQTAQASGQIKEQTFDLVYDKNGNLIQDQNYIYEYNALNQLTEIKDGSTSEVISEYSYDNNGERVKKVEHKADGDEITYYIDDNFIRVVNSSGTFDTVYYLQDGQLIAREENGQKFYYHPDHLGSTNIVTDESGNVVEKTEYAPFGAVLEGGSGRFLFTGQESDKESGLMYYGARYYSPSLARFTQPDTEIQDIYDPQSLNRYSYARNNPLKYKDDTGHWIHIVVGAAIGALIGAGSSIAYQLHNGASWSTLDWGSVGKSAAVGTAAGGVGAATFGAGLAIAGESVGGYTIAGGASGLISGRTGQFASNIAYGNSLGENMLNFNDMVRDTTLGAAFGLVGGTHENAAGLFGSESKPFLKGMTFPENPNTLTKQLGVNPEITSSKNGYLKWATNDEIGIRYHSSHSVLEGKEFNPYENLPHYAVDYKNPITSKWDKLLNQKTGGHNFLPGEEFP
ncbi:MAG: RHS repeat-associated core domain-containing protein [Candidatus Paceibacterota bacterium]